jgi:zinc/manganese transport system substrate-binding protein
MIRGRHRPVLVAAVLLGAMVMPLAPGVSASLRPARHPRVINVVAAEDTWGSLAAQLGGRLVVVTSVITNPNADPHEYEASTAVARSIGGANFVIVNGAGYDDWAQKILAANPAPHRFVLDIAKFLGKKPGDNPHFWYDPKYVFAVIDEISADYIAVDPAGASYFRQCLAKVEASLVPYRKALASLARRDAGVKVASTESIFQYLAEYLGLDLVTPYPFMQAVADGYDPPVGAVATFEHQISVRGFRVLVYNDQTITALTTTIRDQVEAKHIPVVGISETLQPSDATFQSWMLGELDRVGAALGERHAVKSAGARPPSP